MSSDLLRYEYQYCCSCEIKHFPRISNMCNEVPLLHMPVIIYMQIQQKFSLKDHPKISKVSLMLVVNAAAVENLCSLIIDVC